MNLPVMNETTRKLLTILVVIAITFILTRGFAYLMHKMAKSRDDLTAIYLVRDIISYIIYFVAIMIILQLFGINLAGTLLSLGIVGIAVSFAAKDIISNLFSGIILILGRSVKVGDTIELDGKKGYVERIYIRSTIIVDDYGVKNNVPNSILTNNEYLVYKDPEKFRVDIFTGMPLNIDIENFYDYILERIRSYPAIADDPHPDIFAQEISFKQSKVKVSFWVKDFKDKDKYKIIITNEIRKYVQKGEKDE